MSSIFDIRNVFYDKPKKGATRLQKTVPWSRVKGWFPQVARPKSERHKDTGEQCWYWSYLTTEPFATKKLAQKCLDYYEKHGTIEL